MTVPTAVAVVVPVRDEEALLPGCLDAIEAALRDLREARPGLPARVFVVLDACTDRSSEIVAARPGVTAVVTHAGNVGIARALGIAAAGDWAATVAGDALAGDALWVATTDGDSLVPRRWLSDQVTMAGSGLDLVVGTVRPRPDDLSDEALERWHDRHTSSDGHTHVHGANLGFRWQAYRSVGGFAPIATHEDVELVGALRRAGVPWIASGRIEVVTSGRRTGRAPGGFAQYLEDMGA